MTIRLKIFIVVIFALCMRCSVMAGSDSEKARNIFLEAVSQKSLGNDAAYFDLLRHAHRLDTANTAIGFQYGVCLCLMNNSSEAERALGMRLIKRHADANPRDIYIASAYSKLCFNYGDNANGLLAIERLVKADTTNSTALQLLSEAYMQVEDYDNALKTFGMLERQEGYSSSIAISRVNAQFHKGDTTATIAEMRRLLNTAPQNAYYNLCMSEVFQKLDMPDSARHYLDRAQQLEPDDARVVLARAQHFFTSGDTVAYTNEIKKAMANKDLELDDKLSLLRLYSQIHISDSTFDSRNRELFDELVLQHPHESEVHRLYSAYLMAKEDYKGAREQMQYALDSDPANADDWKSMFVIDLLQEDYKHAKTTAQKALEYNPDDVQLYGYVASAYTQMKEYDNAIATFDTAIAKAREQGGDEAGKTLGDLTCGKADATAAKGDTIAAFKLYELSLQFNPDNEGALNNYAYCLSQSGKDLDKAESMAAKAVAASPNNDTYLDTYAWVFFKKGNYPMALLYIKSAMDHSTKQSAEILEHYGDILFFNDMKEQAVEMWEKAFEQNPTDTNLMRKVETGEYEKSAD